AVRVRPGAAGTIDSAFLVQGPQSDGAAHGTDLVQNMFHGRNNRRQAAGDGLWSMNLQTGPILGGRFARRLRRSRSVRLDGALSGGGVVSRVHRRVSLIGPGEETKK